MKRGTGRREEGDGAPCTLDDFLSVSTTRRAVHDGDPLRACARRLRWAGVVGTCWVSHMRWNGWANHGKLWWGAQALASGCWAERTIYLPLHGRTSTADSPTTDVASYTHRNGGRLLCNKNKQSGVRDGGGARPRRPLLHRQGGGNRDARHTIQTTTGGR